MEKIELPVLSFGFGKHTVEENHKKIEAFKTLLKATLIAVDGLNKANQAFCRHEDKKAEHDPGYAGGGFSNYRCPTCGSGEC